MRFWPLFVLCVLAAPLHARSPGVAIESAVFIERKGSTDLTIEPAQDFRRGERVVTVMRWDAPAGNFTITSPGPRALQFERASADGVQVSTDGGRTWLSVRSAQPEAVTHLRWRVANGPGRLSYSAIVR